VLLALSVGLSVTHGQSYPTEEFHGGGDSFDLAYSSVTFTPTSGGTSYTHSLKDIAQLPTSPAGGINLGLGDDNFTRVSLSYPREVRLFGESFPAFFVGSNGYITFTQGDKDFTETLAEHFEMLRISGLYTDLTAANEGMVTSKQLYDRVAITWQAVPEVSNSSPNTFQIEMFFDGRIRLSWLQINAEKCIVGLSNGGGLRRQIFQMLGACFWRRSRARPMGPGTSIAGQPLPGNPDILRSRMTCTSAVVIPVCIMAPEALSEATRSRQE